MSCCFVEFWFSSKEITNQRSLTDLTKAMKLGDRLQVKWGLTFLLINSGLMTNCSHYKLLGIWQAL